jgi:hypothetical protein
MKLGRVGPWLSQLLFGLPFASEPTLLLELPHALMLLDEGAREAVTCEKLGGVGACYVPP